MTFGSLFAGAGGFDMGFDAAGFACAWQVEIDRTARDVLARHWPDVARHLDVRGVGKENLARVDVVVGGFPCQDVSTAGKRGGFEGGERSSLWYEMLRVIDELRPAYVVWENVPGLLSADDGRALGWVLRGLADLGFDGGWRTVDAQFFGVPQQRRRVFGVFARGRFGAERCAEILALAEGVRRRTPKGRKAGKGAAAAAAGGAGSGRVVGTFTEGRHAAYDASAASCPLRTGGGGRGAANLVVFGGGDCRSEPLAAATIQAKGVRQDFDTDNFVLIQDARAVDLKAQGGLGVRVSSVSYTLDTLGAQAVMMPGGVGCLAPDATPKGRADGLAYTLTGRATRGHGHGMAVCVTGTVTHALTVEGHDASGDGTGRGTPIVAFAQNQRGEVRYVDPPPAVTCGGGKPGEGYPAVQIGPVVRRLTPRECTRLMGWPDDWLELEHFDDKEANLARAVLQHLWRGLGTQAFREATGGLGRLLSPEVLLAGVHGGWVSWPLLAECAAARGAVPGETAWPEATVRAVREHAQRGPSPYRREAFEQLAEQLGRSVPVLPPEGSSFGSAVFYRGVWEVAQGPRFLQHALPEMEAVGRPFRGEGESKRLADGPRYRLCGNGVVGAVSRWIAGRMATVMGAA